MKIELVVNGRVEGECSHEADFLSFQAAVFNALAEMQSKLELQRRERADKKMALFNEKLSKTGPKDRNSADQSSESPGK